MRRSAGAAFAAWMALAGPAAALDDGDRTAFRKVIDRQIEAFKGDDAAAAYGLASPSIKQMFGSPERFLGMVRQGYGPVYRPRRYEFGEAKDTAAGPEQSVRIDDAEGVGWTAIYSLERQPDGEWAISGCRLERARDQTV